MSYYIRVLKTTKTVWVACGVEFDEPELAYQKAAYIAYVTKHSTTTRTPSTDGFLTRTRTVDRLSKWLAWRDKRRVTLREGVADIIFAIGHNPKEDYPELVAAKERLDEFQAKLDGSWWKNR